MSAPTCACGCDRPVPDGYASPDCMDRARAQLAEIADMAQAARDVAQRQARYGGGGGASGKPGSSLPINLGATARLDAVQNALTTWVRAIAEERGAPAEINAGAFGGASEWAGMGESVRDDLSGLALWLADHCEWMRHRAEVDEFLVDVEACARVVRGIARGPAEQRYLGPCGADRTAEVAEGLADVERCDGDVRGPRGGTIGTCRTCGAEVDQDERRAWLDDQVRDTAFRASEIEDAYGVSANLIRQWATPARGLLLVHGRDWWGRALYVLGDVLEVAAAQAAKRAEAQAKRARREAAA